MLSALLLVLFVCCTLPGPSTALDTVSPPDCVVWGPGLEPHVVVPVRYFFIQLKDEEGNNVTKSVGTAPISIVYADQGGSVAIRMHSQLLDRHDGSYIVRYKLFKDFDDLKISVLFNGKHIANSPYLLKGHIYPEGCDCPVNDINKWLKVMKCPKSYPQIRRDLKPFKKLDMKHVEQEIKKRFDHPGSRSLCHYVIKDNKLYRSTMGKHVGFKMFSDSILHSLMRKVHLPDLDFWINLGDWPLENKKETENPLPIISWCGSTESRDIILPTYDVTDSTLETMGRCENITESSLEMPTYDMDAEKLDKSCRVTLDLMSVQGNTPIPWEEKIEQAFWRGRDSRRERLNLIKIAKENPDLMNVSLTNMFFFKHDVEEHGELVKPISFFEFFKYKYQLNIDGTVAAYRFPYLMAGGSLIVKQESSYYEHFYNELKPYEHYLPMKHDLSDVVERLRWAKEHDAEAQQMARNARQFVEDNLMPRDIFCYHVILLKEYAKRQESQPEVREGMEFVPNESKSYQRTTCTCNRNKKKIKKDEL